MSRLTKRALRLVRTCIDRERILADNETVVVGISGGADSLCLLHLLDTVSRRGRRNWDIRPVHIDPGFSGSAPERVVRACRRLGHDCATVRIDVPAELGRSRLNPCHVCSQLRRRALFRYATGLGCRKVALGHHIEDVNETFLLNLLYTASAATILPSQSLFKGTLQAIRPLYLLDKPLIRAVLRSAGATAVRNPCPYHKTGARLAIRRFLARLERAQPRIQNNLFWGLHNLKPQYLPHRRRPAH